MRSGCLAAALGAAALAAAPAAAEGIERGSVHRVPRAASAIEIDGALGDAAWGGALRLEMAYEVDPGENTPAPVRTECFLTYDDRNFYVGFRAHDPDPSRILARYSDRDKAWSDDWIGVALDTFNDQRRAYELIVNPLGVQIDALNDDIGGSYDTSWNAIWESAGRITAEGYEVEMAIPFHQIRFQRSDGEQTWGFDAFRSWPRGDRFHIGLFPRERGANSYLAQTVKIVGMAGASPGDNLEIAPTATTSRTDERDPFPEGPLEKADATTELGASLRWGVTPDVSLNGAVNPDFSQVEADVLQLDINEQFALFYPETRPFFLEGADYFRTPLDLVHTRNVADPAGAAKLTGKQGHHTWGVFTARDDVTNVLFPGPEESASGSFAFESWSSAARYRLDLGKSSTAGGTVTDRRGDGYRNTVASADAVFRFTENDRLTVVAARSETRDSEEMLAFLEESGFEPREGGFSDRAVAAEFEHSVREWWIAATCFDIGDGFRSDLGFRTQAGHRGAEIRGARVLWGERGDFHRRMAVGAGAEREEDSEGALLEQSAIAWWNLNGPKDSFLGVTVDLSDRSFEGVRYDDQWEVEGIAEVQATGDLWVRLEAAAGDAVDHENNRPGDGAEASLQFTFKPGRHLSVQFAHRYARLDVEEGMLFRAHAPELRLVQQFNARAFVRAVVQLTDIRRDPDLYVALDPEDRPDARSRDLFTQLLFSYKVNAQTALYAGYSDRSFGGDDFDTTRASRTFFLKLGYAWLR